MINRVLKSTTTQGVRVYKFMIETSEEDYEYSINDGEFVKGSGDVLISEINCGLGGNTGSLISQFDIIKKTKITIRHNHKLFVL